MANWGVPDMQGVRGGTGAIDTAPPRLVPRQAGPDARMRALLDDLRVEAAQADRDGDAGAAADLRRAAVSLASRHGAATREDVARAPEAPARATCFGAFSLVVDGRPLPLSGLRPRARSVLRLLALQGGRPLHREVLLASLWPETDQVSAARSMLTTLSSVRSVLASTPAAGALSREGAAYRLATEAVVTDVALADAALERARRVASDPTADVDGDYAAVLDLYAGDLLVEEGPADWVVEPREQWRVRMAGAAHELAVLRYRRGKTAAAAAAARRGLAIDRHSDQLWRVLVAALRAGEDDAAAERAEAGYSTVLGELAVG